MDINLLITSATQLLKHCHDALDELEPVKIESDINGIAKSIHSLALSVNDHPSVLPTIEELKNAIHDKIEAALSMFSNLGKIAASLLAKGESVLEELKAIYNMMIGIIKSLQPIEAIVVGLYPMLIPLFAVLNALPAIP